MLSSAVEILFDCDVNSSCTSFNVPAVIDNETAEFASKLCGVCETVFGFFVSSETQLSTALSTVKVFHVFAVTFTISLIVVCHALFCCSIVNKYGNSDGKIVQSFTIIDVELADIEATKYELTLFAVLYHTYVIFATYSM